MFFFKDDFEALAIKHFLYGAFSQYVVYHVVYHVIIIMVIQNHTQRQKIQIFLMAFQNMP